MKPSDLKALQEAEARQTQIHLIRLRNAFGGEGGASLLEALRFISGADSCAFVASDSDGKIDPFRAALVDGRRSLYLDIQNIAKIPEEQLS